MNWWNAAQWWQYAVGLAYAVLVGHLCTYIAMKHLWIGVYGESPDETVHPHREHPMMVGVTERSLYYSAWIFGKPEFLAVWLAMKIAGQWSRWTTGEEIQGIKVQGRCIFNVFLLGNGFSIVFGFVGGLLTEWLATGQWSTALLVMCLPVATSIAYARWAYVANLSRAKRPSINPHLNRT